MLAHTNAVRWANVISAVFCFLDFLTFGASCVAGLVFLVVGVGESDGFAALAAFGPLGATGALVALGFVVVAAVVVAVAVPEWTAGDTNAVGGLGWGFCSAFTFAFAFSLVFSGGAFGVAIGAVVAATGIACVAVCFVEPPLAPGAAT